MKALHSRSVLSIFTVAALAISCASSSNDTTSGIDPLNDQTGGSASGGPGGSASGASLGGSAPGTGGSASGSAGGSTSGNAGGSPAGGAIGVVTMEQKPCEKKVRTAGKTIPDFMIVLDRSGSMKPGFQAGLNCAMPDIVTVWICLGLGIDCNDPSMKNTVQCGGTMESADRWTPAVAAVKSLTKMFESKVNFGLTTFPGGTQGNGGGGGGGGRDQSCATGMQRVPVGLNTANAIGQALDATQPGGNTPTGPTLDAVLKQIQAKKASPDDVLPPQYVLLVTDGQPTCPMGQGNNNAAAHQATIAAIDALAKAGVKTYVIGYDASVNAALAKQLTEYAQHGGTNDFYAVQDGPSLVTQFTAITSVVAECSYQLDKKPDDPKYVRVELDGKPLNLGDANGWSIDERNVTIQGDACTKLRDGNSAHTLAVTVECAPVPLF